MQQKIKKKHHLLIPINTPHLKYAFTHKSYPSIAPTPVRFIYSTSGIYIYPINVYIYTLWTVEINDKYLPLWHTQDSREEDRRKLFLVGGREHPPRENFKLRSSEMAKAEAKSEC